MPWSAEKQREYYLRTRDQQAAAQKKRRLADPEAWRERANADYDRRMADSEYRKKRAAQLHRNYLATKDTVRQRAIRWRLLNWELHDRIMRAAHIRFYWRHRARVLGKKALKTARARGLRRSEKRQAAGEIARARELQRLEEREAGGEKLGILAFMNIRGEL